MKRVALSFAVASLTSTTALAADLAVKATPAGLAAASPTTPVWDVAITGALMSDYNFRGITQSNHRPLAAAGFEPRYISTQTCRPMRVFPARASIFPIVPPPRSTSTAASATIQLFHTSLDAEAARGQPRGQEPFYQEIQPITWIWSAIANIDLYEILIISFVVPSRIPMHRVSLTRARTGGKIQDRSEPSGICCPKGHSLIGALP
jgi:hypothetical protein